MYSPKNFLKRLARRATLLGLTVAVLFITPFVFVVACLHDGYKLAHAEIAFLESLREPLEGWK